MGAPGRACGGCRVSNWQDARMDRNSQRSPLRWWSAATCVWSLVFAAPHFYWAAGGRAGLRAEAGAADAALSQSWFAAYNLATGVLAVVGAVVAVLLLRAPGDFLRVLRAAAWVACAVLFLRGVVGMTGLAVEAARGVINSPPMLVAIEPWFLLGGVLFGVLAARTKPRVDDG